MKKPKEIKVFPSLGNDKQAEHSVDTADLSEYDFSGFKPARFEFAAKDSNINMRGADAIAGRGEDHGGAGWHAISALHSTAHGKRHRSRQGRRGIGT